MSMLPPQNIWHSTVSPAVPRADFGRSSQGIVGGLVLSLGDI
jgi:hypothetical protein